MSPYFTVFTSTYNRRDLLPSAYASLQRQTLRDFEWIIVDDGSTDGTRELVDTWKNVATFPIRYFWQPNQHKKVAHNRAVREAKGDLFVILDSDDELVPHALERFKYQWSAISQADREKYFGVWALCIDEKGALVGTRFPDSPNSASIFDILLRHKVAGDKCIAVRVDVLKQYPFPEEVQGFVPEGLVWNQIGMRYIVGYFNEALVIVHRHHGGESITQGQNSKRHATGRALYEREFFKLSWPWFRFAPLMFCKRALQFVRFHMHCKESIFRASMGIPGRWLILAMAPIGALIYWMDILRDKMESSHNSINAF